MKKQLAAIAYRRHELIKKIEAQRGEMAEITRSFQKPLVLVDAGLKTVRFIRDHPGWVSGGFAALLSLRGMGVAGLAQKGWRLLYLYPAIASLGLKYLFSSTGFPKEGRNTDLEQ